MHSSVYVINAVIGQIYRCIYVLIGRLATCLENCLEKKLKMVKLKKICNWSFFLNKILGASNIRGPLGPGLLGNKGLVVIMLAPNRLTLDFWG